MPSGLPDMETDCRSLKDVFADTYAIVNWVLNKHFHIHKQAGDLRRYHAHYDVTVMNFQGPNLANIDNVSKMVGLGATSTDFRRLLPSTYFMII